MAEKWYNLTPEQIEERLSTDLGKGLNPKQAAARLRREGKNTVYKAVRPDPGTLAKEVLRDPCAYILLAAALLAWIFNEKVGAPIIILLVALNAFFVTLAYIKARSVISDAHIQALPTATVLRGGKQYLIKHNMICRGDVIILHKGDIVPADARLISAENLRCIETSLTGEVGKKIKNAKIVYGNNLDPTRQSDMVFATTIVAEGYGVAVVCETGEETYACRLGKNVEVGDSSELGVFESLKKHCTAWSFIMLVLVFVLTLVDFVVGFESRSIFNIFITGLSLATAGMCEYYLIFGYMITGCGLYGMLKRQKNIGCGSVIKKISDIEKLSGITTLIVPKESAFVTGNIRLQKLYCDSTVFSSNERNLHNSCKQLISAAFDSTVYIENDYEKTYNSFKARDVSIEEKTIFTLAADSGVFDGPVYMGDHIAVERKIEGDLTRSRVKVHGNSRVVLRGRYEDVMPMCTKCRINGETKSLKGEKSRVQSALKHMKSEGLYGVCIATKDTPDINDGEDFVFEGFLAINEPVLTGARENILRILEAGIKIIMLSEDSSVTGRNFAKALGIISSDDQIMTATQLSNMTDDLFRTNASVYRLYEGLDIPQKRLLLTHLQQNGESVGYFGQNFEDIILIREADVGFSTGVTLLRGNSVVDMSSENAPVILRSEREKGKGSEALKQVCDVVVSPADGKGGGFNAIASSIAQSRLVLRSLSRAVRYLITSQCARLFVFLYSVIVPDSAVTFCGEAVFTPVQLLTLGLVFDLLVVVAFAFKSSRGRLAEREVKRKTNPFTDNLVPMLFGVFWGVVALVTPVILRLCGADVTNTDMSTMIFFGFMLTQIVTATELMSRVTVFKASLYSTSRLVFALVLASAFMALCVLTPIGGIFGVNMLSIPEWIFTVLQPLLVLTLYEIYKLIKRENTDDTDKEA